MGIDVVTLALAKGYTDRKIQDADFGDVPLDTSLTKKGQAADAKAVGDAISKLSGGNVAYDKAQELTDEQKAQARENIDAQPKGNYLTEHQSLEGYAKTTDIPTKPEDIGAQPAGNYLTEVPEGYAKTEDIPTDEHINSLINTALGVIENGTY